MQGIVRGRVYLTLLPEGGRLPGPRQDEEEVLEQNSPEQGSAEAKNSVSQFALGMDSYDGGKY